MELVKWRRYSVECGLFVASLCRRAGRCLQLVRPIRGSGGGGSESGLLSPRALIGSPEKLHYIHGEERSGANIIMTIPTKTILHEN